ncbi:MAG: helix-turn-helix transcriptional regulator [Peptococcaceae bacterium]|nr:helix-turn-helix transcriptional regulator [Peptococcaceae bacterium]
MLASRLRLLRTKKGLSQRELAKLIKIAPSTLAMYEVGKREPDYNTLEKIADFYGVTTDYLLGRTDNPKGNVDEYDPKLKKALEDPAITDLLMKVPDLTEEEKQSLAEHWAYVMDFIERKRQERKKQQND